MPTAARVLWRAAQQPLRSGVTEQAAPCWWCGLPFPWTGPVSLVSDTFPHRQMARAPRSTRLCAACAWTLCETVALPPTQGTARIASLAAQGRRAQVSVSGAPSARYLILRLASGEVGLWQASDSAKKEEAWKASTPQLREHPRDVEGIPLLHIVPIEALAPDATEKFRSYHHFGGDYLPWEVATDSDKARIRQILLSPPKGAYAAVIGDGQKHGAIYAEPGFGPVDCAVYFVPAGATLRYDPVTLATQIHAVEQLVLAGADDAHIVSGRYQRPGIAMQSALILAEPVVRPIRGSALLDLCLYFRRPRPILQEDTALAASLCPPPTCIRSLSPAHLELEDAPGIVEPQPAGRSLAESGSPSMVGSVPPRRDPEPDHAGNGGGRTPEPERPRQLSLFGI